MSEWKESLLENLADEITVGFVGSMTEEYVETGIPFLRSKNVEPFRINNDDMRYISKGFHERIKKSALSPGDVVIVRTGKPGSAAIIPDSLSNANCSDLVIVRPSSNLDRDFLVYYLNSIAVRHINSYLVGAVQQHFNIGAARQLKIFLPSIAEQKQVSSVLTCLDRKIDNLRRQNETLEAIAQTLFKHWFIDFEFPDADGKPYKSSGGEMVDSAIGDIPEGWEARKLDDLTKISTGKGLKRDDFKNNGVYPVLGANGEIGRTDQFLTEGESILTGRVGTLGIVNINYVKAWISDNVIIFNPFDNFFYYTYFYLKNTNLKNLNRGSTQPLITQGDLKAIET